MLLFLFPVVLAILLENVAAHPTLDHVPDFVGFVFKDLHALLAFLQAPFYLSYDLAILYFAPLSLFQLGHQGLLLTQRLLNLLFLT